MCSSVLVSAACSGGERLLLMNLGAVWMCTECRWGNCVTVHCVSAYGHEWTLLEVSF
jgi:hypothetical protein